MDLKPLEIAGMGLMTCWGCEREWTRSLPLSRPPCGLWLRHILLADSQSARMHGWMRIVPAAGRRPVRANIFVEPPDHKNFKLRPGATSSENIPEDAAPMGLMICAALITINMPLLRSCLLPQNVCTFFIRGHCPTRGSGTIVRDYPYFGCTCLTRSRPLARSQGDLYSDGAEYIPLAVSQTARVFVTTPCFWCAFA